jgi:putative endonuclease
MYQVYILKSLRYGRYYVGYSEDLNARLISHNVGRVRSTKAYKPWIVVYSEVCPDKQFARKRELEIKSYKSGEAFKRLIK